MNMIKFYKTTAGILAVLLASQIVSCGDAERRSSDDTTGDAESNPVEETIDPAYETGLEIRDLGGEFRIATFENSNFHYKVYAGEETGELLNDAIYKRNRSIKDTYNISIVQFLYADFSNEVRNSVTAGDDAYDLVTVRCTDALTWWHDGLLIPYDELPNIDLEKKYWDQSINASLTIGGTSTSPKERSTSTATI